MKKIFIFISLFIFIFLGCQEHSNSGIHGSPHHDNWNTDSQGTAQKRKWTFIIYMAADNDLESAAIANLNELEAVRYGNSPISILVLLDRNPYYDRTNGNWHDTRLFEVKSDPNGLNSTIISTRLDCPELGLTRDTETELNTADPLVLSRLIDFAKRTYPAEHYALFIWGHGTGWRGTYNTDTLPQPLKAIAFDDTHGQYMSLPAFGRAINGKGLSVIGFDTCYAAILELVYQIRNDAALFVGSQGAIMSSGWDYFTLFTDFIQKPNLSISDLGDSIQYQFSQRYGGLNNSTFSQVKLSHVNNLFLKFEIFTGTVSEAITDEKTRNAILDIILKRVESYYFTNFPSDLYIDIFDFSKKLIEINMKLTEDTIRQNDIINAGKELEDALNLAIPSSWSKNGSTKKIGVHVIPLQGISVPVAFHELAYVRGSMAMDKSDFVENSRHWVPNAIPQNTSLLDKLFYWNY